MCLGENEPVEEVNIDGKNYLVFKCLPCKHKSYDFDRKCIECERTDGYMTRLTLTNDKEDSDTQPGKAWIHPICAISYPKIYQMTSPEWMTFKLCKDVDTQNLYKISEENGVIKSCCLCNNTTARMLSHSSENDGSSEEDMRYAHPYCLYSGTMPTTFEVDIK